MRNILRVEADIKGQRRVPAYTVTQNDSVSIIVTVLDGGSPVNLDEVSTMTIACTRRDGNVVVKAGTQSGPNEVTFDLGTTEIEKTGKVDAVIQLYSADGRVSTIKFSFMVTKDPTGDGYVPSEDERTLIEVVLGDGPLVLERAETAALNAEGATAYIDEKKPLIDKFTDEQTSLQAQLDEVARGATNVETSQARVSTTGTAYGTLKQRLDAEYEEVTTQLAQKATKEELLNKRDKSIPINQNDISDELRQQITGTTPINAVPAKGSITRERLSPKLIGVDQTDFASVGKNLFDKDNVISGFLISNDGGLTENSNYHVSDFILIEPNTEYHFNIPPIFAWYDEQFNFISRVYQESGVFLSPNNARYLRVSTSTGYLPNLQVEKNNVGTTYENYKIYSDQLRIKGNQIENLDFIHFSSLDGITTGKNLFDKSKAITQGIISSSTGNVNSSPEYADYRISDYIEVVEGEFYSKNKNSLYAFYDEHKNYVPVNFDGTTYGGSVDSFPIPTGAKYIRLSPHIYDLDSFQFEKNIRPTTYEKFGYKIDKLLIKPTNLPTKFPSPAIVSETRYRAGGSSKTLTYVDDNGTIWANNPNSLVLSSNDGENFEVIFDAKPFLNEGESISTRPMYVSDTGRIIVSTNQGRVLVSDEAKTTMSEAFKFKAGETNLYRGHCKYGKFILMGSYLANKNAENPGREVYLSKDHGATWELIFDKPIENMLDAGNYHIHDVAFDQFSNMIMVSIGDGLNRQIHYSYDFGQTWHDVFPESDYSLENLPPIHPTSILCFPDGIAFGSDELPEGISWWNRPQGITEPTITWDDIDYVKTFGEKTGLIGTYAMKGDTLHTQNGFYGVMPFRNHNTTTVGHPRLFVTGDGGRSWHEVFKETVWSPEYQGFMNAILKEENGKIYIYSSYSQLGTIYIWKAEMPRFYEV